MDIERKRMDTKGIGKLSLRLAQSRLELTGCLLAGTHSCLGAVRTATCVARALVLLQLAHKLTSLVQRFDLALRLPV